MTVANTSKIVFKSNETNELGEIEREKERNRAKE